MNSTSKKFNVTIEWFRIITPAMCLITLFVIGAMNGKLDKIDTKLFSHLTNHEMHVPREQFTEFKNDIVSRIDKTEYNIKEFIKTRKR